MLAAWRLTGAEMLLLAPVGYVSHTTAAGKRTIFLNCGVRKGDGGQGQDGGECELHVNGLKGDFVVGCAGETKKRMCRPATSERCVADGGEKKVKEWRVQKVKSDQVASSVKGGRRLLHEPSLGA